MPRRAASRATARHATQSLLHSPRGAADEHPKAARVQFARTHFPNLRTIAATAAIAAAAFAGAQPASVAPEKLPPPLAIHPLTRSADVRAPDGAAESANRLVELRGTVTFVHPDGTFYLQEPTGAMAARPESQTQPRPAVGDIVRVSGRTEPGARLPFVRANRIAIEGHGALPAPAAITPAEALGESREYQWVELEGDLLENESLGDWQRLRVGTADGEFSVSIPSAEPVPAAEGARLRIRGVCNVWQQSGTAALGGFFLFTPTPGDVQEIADDDEAAPPPITDIRSLHTRKPRPGQPVDLRGVVTFAHPDQRLFYLDDDTGGVLVWPSTPALPLPAVGARLRLHGVATIGPGATTVRADRIETSGIGPLPAAHPIGIGQAAAGGEDAQWVEMRGHLRQVETGGGWLQLFLTTAAGEITVSIPHASSIAAKVGSFLAVRGVCQSWTDEHGRIAGFFLYSPSTAELTECAPAPADPFAVPEESIANLARYRTRTLEMQQVRLRGTVLHHIPGRSLILRNGDDTVRVFSNDTASLVPGDVVEVAGVPGRRGHHSVLRGATYRRLQAGPAPEPRALTQVATVAPELDGHLVSLQGVLNSIALRPTDTRMLLDVGGTMVEAIHSGPLPAGEGTGWKPGSRLALTGLYNVEGREDEEVSHFILQIRHPAEVVVLSSPPWWTAGRARTALGAIAAVLLAGLGWVAVLRRQIRRQTTVIRRQLAKEAALEVRHGVIIEHASDAIFTTDLEGRFLTFNPAAESMTGYSEAEMLRRRLADLLPPDSPEPLAGFLAQARHPDPAAAHFEAQFQTRAGERLWVEISARAIREDGAATGLLGIARDITARRQMEKLDRQIQKAESLGRMAAAIAHNFNNQIQAVSMGLEMLRFELPKDPAIGEILGAAERSARQASQVGKLMLTYLGQSPGTRKSIDLAALAREAIARWRKALPSGMALDTEIPESLARVRADPEQIIQAITCLLANAQEAAEGTGGTIRLAVGTADPASIPNNYRRPIDFQALGETYACITISDTGGGIAAKDLEKIFDPYFTTRFHGRGMGLAVALGIVRSYDGAVAVENRPGQGATFSLLLPFEASEGR